MQRSRFPENNRTWTLLRLIQCIRGPKLRRLNFEGRSLEVSEVEPGIQNGWVCTNWNSGLICLSFLQGCRYEPNNMEKYADNVITAVSIVSVCSTVQTAVYVWLP